MFWQGLEFTELAMSEDGSNKHNNNSFNVCHCWTYILQVATLLLIFLDFSFHETTYQTYHSTFGVLSLWADGFLHKLI
jgi:hypothetical protein